MTELVGFTVTVTVHRCPDCGGEFECIYGRCVLPRDSVCFSCFAKPWHEQRRG